MCGRYKLQDPDWVEADFSTTFPTLSDYVRRPRFNVAPGQLVLAVRQLGAARTLEEFKWGVETPWKGGPSQLINARAEKLADSRLWKPLLESGRCAIPADGFYEWKAPDVKGAPKRPYLFTRNGGDGFWLAGLYSQGPDGQQCVVITVEPNDLVEGVHNRMPAMLVGESLEAWLSDDAQEARDALGPFPSTAMTALEIGRAIGNAAREGPELIDPAPPEGPDGTQATLLD